MSSMTPLKSANGPVTTRTCSPTSHSGLKRGLAFSSSSWTPRNRSTSLRERGVGFSRVAGDEPGDAGSVADRVPGVVVEGHPDEDVAREYLLGDGLLLSALELDHVLHRDVDLEDPVLHVHRLDPGLEVCLDLVLIARVGVDDVPVTGHVVGAGRNLRRGLFTLDFALDVALNGSFGPFVDDSLLDDGLVHVNRRDLDSVHFGRVDLDLGLGGPDVVGDLSVTSPGASTSGFSISAVSTSGIRTLRPARRRTPS